MTLARTDLTVKPYKRENPSVLDEDVRKWLQLELTRIEQAIRDTAEAAPQVADKAPSSPRRGTLRYAVSPWNPLGTGDGWVWFNGTAWIKAF